MYGIKMDENRLSIIHVYILLKCVNIVADQRSPDIFKEKK